MHVCDIGPPIFCLVIVPLLQIILYTHASTDISIDSFCVRCAGVTYESAQTEEAHLHCHFPL